MRLCSFLARMSRKRKSSCLKFAIALSHLFTVIGPSTGQCPVPCLCTGASVVQFRADCTGLNFTAVPADSLPRTYELNLDRNLLADLSNLQVYPNLTILSIKNNLITEIEPGDFANLTMLEKLELEGNPLRTITEPVFEGLSDLQELNLRSSELGTLDSSAFNGLPQLSTLLLGANNLRGLSGGIFSQTTQLESISLADNDIKSLEETLFQSLPATYSLDLTANPLSCDCELEWLYDAVRNRTGLLTSADSTLCHWPDYLRGLPLTSLTSQDFLCFQPTLVEPPMDQTVFTTEQAIVACNVTAQPRPSVTWYKNGHILLDSDGLRNTSAASEDTFARLTVLGDGSLQISNAMHEDQGGYYCFVFNDYGMVKSDTSFLTVLESTCFNNMLDSQEADVDCGGLYCEPCNQTQTCRADGDCRGELVCLYHHQLPSGLLYISPQDMQAYTCDDPDLPHALLEERLKGSLLEIGFSVRLNVSAQVIADNLRSFLSSKLQIPLLSISNVRLSTVERKYQPLIQMWFDLQRIRLGEEAVNSLTRQLNEGVLLGTLKIDSTSSDSVHRVRLNL